MKRLGDRVPFASTPVASRSPVVRWGSVRGDGENQAAGGLVHVDAVFIRPHGHVGRGGSADLQIGVLRILDVTVAKLELGATKRAPTNIERGSTGSPMESEGLSNPADTYRRDRGREER